MLRRLIAPLGFCLLSLIWLWPLVFQPAALAYQPGAEYSDLTISHWPNAYFLRRSLAEFHQVPLWNPDHLGGQPFAADPLSGLWYPPNWLVILPFIPIAVGFNLLFALHMAWAGWGLFCYLRAVGLSAGPSFFGGLVFAGTPKLVAHIGAGHVSLVFAVCWTPWLLLAAHRARDLRGGALAGVILGTIFLADPRWMPLAGLLAVALYLRERRDMRPLLGMVLFSLAMSAALSLPLAEFLSLSARSSLTPADSAVFSLPPAYLAGMWLADLGGFQEFILYPGALVLILAGIGLLGCLADSGKLETQAGEWEMWQKLLATGQQSRSPAPLFWLSVFLVSLLFALGPVGGLQPIAFRWLPGFSALRVPSRALFLTLLSLAVLAAIGLARLQVQMDGRAVRRASIILVAYAGFAVLLGGGYALGVGRPLENLIGFGILTLLASALVLVRMRQRLGYSGFLVLASLLVIADLLWVNSSLLEARRSRDAFAAGQAVARHLAQEPGQFRVYSPSYSLPQHEAARAHLSQADGVNPLQIADYVHAMRIATGITESRYTVTLPAYENGDPSTANRSAVPNPRALGLLNIGHVVSAFPLDQSPSACAVGQTCQSYGDLRGLPSTIAKVPRNGVDLESQGEMDGTWVYSNPFVQPRAWLTYFLARVEGPTELLAAFAQGQPATESGGINGPKQVAAVRILEWSPNRIRLWAEADKGKGMVLVSGVAYPGWRATVEGRQVPLEPVSLVLRGVQVGPGNHNIVLNFRPWSVYAGLAITLAGCLAFARIWWWGERSSA